MLYVREITEEHEGAGLARARTQGPDTRTARLAALRLVGHLSKEERAALLEDLGSIHDFAEPGSVSDRLMNHLWRLDTDEAFRAELVRIFDQVAAPMHLRAILPALIEEIERQALEEEKWKDVGKHIKLEVPVDAYALTLVDMNGYTSCLIHGEHYEKAATASAIVVAYNRVAEETGALLLEPIEGDAGVFVTFSAEQQRNLETALEALRVPMRIERLNEERHSDGTEKYPFDAVTGSRVFTKSIGIYPGGEPLSVVAYAGSGAKRGGVVVRGKARREAEALQKQAGPGQTLKKDLSDRAVSAPVWHQAPKAPASNLVTMKVIEALLQLSPYAAAAFDRLLSPEIGPDALTARMDAYYLALDLHTEDESKLDEFWMFITREGSGDDRIQIFKPAGGHGIHFWSQGITAPRDFEEALNRFTMHIAAAAKKLGISFHFSVGHEDALELVPLPGSFSVDATGQSIVATVRGISGLSGKPAGESWASLDRSAVDALGLVGNELVTIFVKGKPYQVMQGHLDEEGRWDSKETLVGREAEIAKVQTFVDQLGRNGLILRIHKPESSIESGYGESALLRLAERYAENQGARVLYAKDGPNMLEDLARSLGTNLDDLLHHPGIISEPALIVLDGELSPKGAAELERFLVTMAGAPIGLAYAGPHQFHMEAFVGEAYRGRELVSELPLEALSLSAATDLVHRARPDLDESDRAAVSVLLKAWDRPFVPRLLIHNFARALIKNGATLELQADISEQIWAGQLDQDLQKEGLTELDRTVLGVVAEWGMPVESDVLKSIFGFDPEATLTRLQGVGFLVFEEGRYRLKNPRFRRARLLARKLLPAVHGAMLTASQSKGAVVLEGGGDVSEYLVELEHAFMNQALLNTDRTQALVRALGQSYFKAGDFAAAYGLFRRFIDACTRLDVAYAAIEPALAKDLIWALTQTAHPQDTQLVEYLLQAQPGSQDAELYWRARFNVPYHAGTDQLATLDEGHPYKAVMDQCKLLAGDLQAKGVQLHQELERVSRLEAGFSHAAQEIKARFPENELLAKAFEGARLSRAAYAARLSKRLSKAVSQRCSEHTDLATELDRLGDEQHLAARAALTSLQAELAFLSPTSEFDNELRLEILRAMLDVYKYLSPNPNEIELVGIVRYNEQVQKAAKQLRRPMQAAELDAFDVTSNAVALHWQSKLPLPGAFPGEDEGSASREGRGAIWAKLDGYEDQVRQNLELAIQTGRLPLRHRLTQQRMNFIQLKLRLLARYFTETDRPLVQTLERSYRALAVESARLHKLMNPAGTPAEADYYGLECAPILNYLSRSHSLSQ